MSNQDPYKALLQRVMVPENLRANRTGVKAYRTSGECMIFPDVSKAFPATTLKKLAFNPVKGEICGFLRGVTSAADFRALGCKVWDANANEHGVTPNAWLSNPFRSGEDDVGPIYGAMWRAWPGYKVIQPPALTEDTQVNSAALTRHDAVLEKVETEGWEYIGSTEPEPNGPAQSLIYRKSIDQLGECVRTIIRSPDSRRILFHGWNPAVLDEIALPACHLLYQFLPDVETRELNMVLYVRSNDLPLGAPFNMAEAGLIMHIIGRLTGYQPKRLSYFIGDAHVYENQKAYTEEMLVNEPNVAPTLWVDPRIPSYDPENNTAFMDASGEAQIAHLIEWLSLIEPTDFRLEGYNPHVLTTPVPPMVV